MSFEESGLTRQQWNTAIGRGEVESKYRNVVRLYGSPSTTEMEIEAAVLGEADVVRVQRQLDALEQRLLALEQRPLERLYRR